MPAKIIIIYSNRHSNFNEALTLKGIPMERLLAKKLAAILVYLPKKIFRILLSLVRQHGGRKVR